MRNALWFALMLLLLPGSVAAQTACPANFAAGQPPRLTNPKLAAQTRELCFRAFAVLHSGLTRTPLWSAEHLTREAVQAARGVGRVNAFHAEERLSAVQRAELSDYARSGFDRGHMAPSGDMPDEASQQESFSLANMVPQAPQLNRGIWEGIESAVRDLAVAEGEVYVLTGPIFQGSNLQALKGRVLVPTETYKAVYAPRRGWGGLCLHQYRGARLPDRLHRAVATGDGARCLSGSSRSNKGSPGTIAEANAPRLWQAPAP